MPRLRRDRRQRCGQGCLALAWRLLLIRIVIRIIIRTYYFFMLVIIAIVVCTIIIIVVTLSIVTSISSFIGVIVTTIVVHSYQAVMLCMNCMLASFQFLCVWQTCTLSA